MRMQSLSFRPVAVGLILFGCLLMGFQSGERAAGYVAYIHRDYGKALEHYSFAGDRSGCGMTYLAMGMPDEAMGHFQAANDLSGQGLAYCKKRKYAEAFRCFQQKGDHSGMGLTFLGLRDEAKAREHFVQANDWSGLGLLALAKQNYVEAQQCFQKAGDVSGLGLICLKQKKFNEALSYYQQAQDSAGVGLVLLASHNNRTATDYFQQENDLSGVGACHMEMGNYRQAFSCFTAANDFNALGDLYSLLHQFAKAREMFEQDHNPVKVIQSYRNDYTLADRFVQALAYGKQAVANGDHAPECLMEMADIEYNLKHFDIAIADLNQAAIYPGYESQTHLLKGRIYFYERQFDLAKAEFQQVKPDDLCGDLRYLEAQQSLGTIALYNGLHVEAAPTF